MSYNFKSVFVWMSVLSCAAWLVAACAVQPVMLPPAPQVPVPTAPPDSSAAAQMQATVDALRSQVAVFVKRKGYQLIIEKGTTLVNPSK